MFVVNNNDDYEVNSKEEKIGKQDLEEIVDIGLKENDHLHGYLPDASSMEEDGTYSEELNWAYR